ncbi:MAG: hypothetical protein WBP55_03085 [Solirubrobacterales bacterium]
MKLGGLKALAAIAVMASAIALPVTSASAAPPVNDNFANAQTVGPALPVSVPATTVEATAEAGEPNIAGNQPVSSIWFRWTAPANGINVVDLCDNGFDGGEYPTERIAVRTGATVATTVLVAERAGECNLRFPAVSGQQYRIQVDYGSDQGSFNFRLRQLAPPANDNFAAATAIGSALPSSTASSTIDSTYEAGEPGALGGPTSSRSVWFAWTPPATGRVRADFCDVVFHVGPLNRILALYTGNSLATLVPVASETSNCILDFQATAGVPLKLAVSGNISGEFNFTLKLKSAPPPANDDFANAITVGPGLPVIVAGDNDFATAEAGEPGHGGFGLARHSLWYRWTAPQNGKVAVRVCGKTFGGRLGVYTGNAVNALTEATIETPPYGPYCHAVLDAVAGTTYHLAAAGGTSSNDYGPFTLDIHTLDVPGNNDFADATDIGSKLPVSVTGTTVDADYESGEPAHTFGYGDQSPSVWYRWTAPSGEPAIFSACSTLEPVQLAVYSGTLLNELKPVAQASEGCPDGTVGGRLAVAPVAGQVYMLAVASLDRDFDSAFTLTGQGPTVKEPVAVPVKPLFKLKKAIKKCKKIKSKKKRRKCIKAARKKAAIIKCKKLKGKKSQKKCVKKARKRFR